MSVVCGSCYRDEDFNLKMLAGRQDVDYDLAVPMFETRLTIANLLSVFGQPENFTEDRNGLVHLVYALPKPLRFDVGAKIDLPAVSLGAFELSSVNYWQHDTAISMTTYDTIDMNIRGLSEGATITKVILDTLEVTIDGSYTIGMASSVNIRFANLLKDGKPFEIRMDLEKGAAVSHHSLNRNLELVLDGALRENPKIIYEVKFQGNMNTAENKYPDVRKGTISLRPKFNKIRYKRIEGYVGKYPIEFEDVLDVSLLQNLNVKDISFYGGRINVTSTLNGCSVPIFIDESGLVCVFEDGTSEQIEMFPEKYTLPYPEPTAAVLEKTSLDTINVLDLLSHKPKEFKYLVKATLNGGEGAETDAPKLNNIIERNSGLDMDITCDLPLHMQVNQFILDDTMPFNSIEQADMLKRFFLKGIVTNAFPLEVYMHLDFLDEKGKVLFSPVNGDAVAGGRVNTDLHVEEPGLYRLDAELSSSELAMLKQTRFIRVWANISTYKKGEAKIYADGEKEGYLRIKLGARAIVRAGGLIGGRLK